MQLQNLPKLPQGYELVDRDQFIEQGDLWAHSNGTHWLKTKYWGQPQFPYNAYARKKDKSSSSSMTVEELKEMGW